jgi:hypothetical protein
MTRTRIESLLASFPKLIPTNIQHTSVETAEVRYVYQPLEDLYILLITNKASNILQDIDTLHLFARVVSDLCRSADEREILKNAFELLGAFDEIVSMGYREQVNLMQVRSVLEMESHEEKIQEIIARVCWTTRNHPFILFNFVFFIRIKKQRPKKNSSAVPNSWKCSVGNSNGALLLVVVVAALGAISVVVPPDTLLSLDSKHQKYPYHPSHVSTVPHLPHQPVVQPSRAVV